MRTLIGQLLIYYLPMGEWWWKLTRAQSRTRHFLCDYSMLFLPHGLHAKKGKISKYNYTSCNHSSVKGQQKTPFHIADT